MEVNVWLSALNAINTDGLKKLSVQIKRLVNNGLSLLASSVNTTSKSKNISQIKEVKNDVRASMASSVAGSFRGITDLLDLRKLPRKEIQLRVRRFNKTPQCTIGEMRCDQAPWLRFYTLEPENPIPCGTYDVTLYKSPHFGRLVPLLHDVNGYEAIEIHTGNYRRDTKGCLLVGSKYNGSSISESTLAFSLLMGVLDGATDIKISIS